ncbi:MAG: ATP-dependent 6-phosphofructokinase [Anaerolineales bacterium]|nr:ATP-dependent 6-phosphofructokinase [Anaerolineales bacterium]
MADRIGILTGGGDAPGLNAVIRAVVKTALNVYGAQVIGIYDGFDGLYETGRTIELTRAEVRGILPRGGTILGTANRGNPFARRVIRDGEEVVVDVSDEVLEKIDALQLDTLIVVGGDGTLRISYELYLKGCPIVGVPKTIDNDIGGTDVTFGFDTAVSTATDAIDKLHTTAESHHRVMVLELMGRDAGFIALHAGIAGGADVILIPEVPFDFEKVCRKIDQRAASGRHFSIIAVAEGAFPAGGAQVYSRSGDEISAARLGGISQDVGEFVAETCAMETRVTVLGHLQRGGQPTAFDRWLATRFGAAAVRMAMEGKHGCMASLQGQQVRDIPLEEALAEPKRVDVEGDAVLTARGLGISLGDE